ncbi:uncharacterized protein LOC132205743 isoform X2 [Neocloeon triangulifer]|uniref:uncharacterized protein LOC132205743 isoform X2 n=1 Tax=Neocloeon triangulifer TaxID=2078957 RepID=UPI00286F3BF5|nr:uncharacterized protein LOC132205743 isoform X2 [Neocloeon triangulifer]
MGNVCHPKQKSQQLTGAATEGKYIATAVPDLVSAAASNNNNGHLENKNFIKIGSKKGVLYLNEPQADESSDPEEEAAKKAEEEARKAEEAAKKKEEEKRKREELKRKQEAAKEEQRIRKQEAEVRKAEEAAKKKEEARQKQAEEEELKRRQEEEKQRRLEEAARKNEEQRKSEEDAVQRLKERKERRRSDDARANTYSFNQLQHSYQNEFHKFLINNTLLAVQFGDESDLFEKARNVCNSDLRENEMNSRMTATGHLKKAVAPDALHEQLSQMIRFLPEDTAYYSNGVPLRPIRVMISHEDILVQHQMENISRPSRITRLCVEQANNTDRKPRKTGYVRLLSMDSKIRSRSLERVADDPQEGYPSYSDPEDHGTIPAAVRVPEASSSDSDEGGEKLAPMISWNLMIDQQRPSISSRRSSKRPSYPTLNSSSSSSGYSYTTIVSLHRHQLLAERRLQLEGATSRVGLPVSCFASKTVPSYDEKSDRLFKTKYYLSSTAFMDNFSGVFADMLGKDLGFLPVWVDEATVYRTTISVKTTQDRLEIIPTVSCKPQNWPEKAVEFILRNRVEAFDQRTQKKYKWPSEEMIREVTSKGYHMIPLGYVPRKGFNPGFEQEWRIEFPEAERYLESRLNDTQLRCYMFCLLLFQVFFKLDGSVTEDHLRHVIFWQAENLTLAWANSEMFNNIFAVYKSLYENLSRKDMPNYFIRKRNDFQSIHEAHLVKVQRKLHDFVHENSFGHIIAALRRLRLSGMALGLDLDRLVELIKTKSTLLLMNPELGTMVTTGEQTLPRRRKGSDESEGLWADLRRGGEDRMKNWRQKAHKALAEERRQEQTTKSVPSKKERSLIEVDVRKNSVFDVLRRRLILEFFIEHFVKMVQNSGGQKLSLELVNHARNLVFLYSEEFSDDDGRVEEWRQQLKRVRKVQKREQQRRQRGPMELPSDVTENWTLQSVEVEIWKGRRLMMDAPPTMVLHRTEEESEMVSTDDTEL